MIKIVEVQDVRVKNDVQDSGTVHTKHNLMCESKEKGLKFKNR
jgi:hypothetical protein